jgi:hypothetical protein
MPPIAKAMTALFALLEPKITSPNSDTLLFYVHLVIVYSTRRFWILDIRAQVNCCKLRRTWSGSPRQASWGKHLGNVPTSQRSKILYYYSKVKTTV